MISTRETCDERRQERNVTVLGLWDIGTFFLIYCMSLPFVLFPLLVFPWFHVSFQNQRDEVRIYIYIDAKHSYLSIATNVNKTRLSYMTIVASKSEASGS